MNIGIKTAQKVKQREGMIHVYSGPGKGKSQAALGIILRSIGLGITTSESRILLVRFLKGEDQSYDEDLAIAAIKETYPHLIDVVRVGRSEWLDALSIKDVDRAEAARGWRVVNGAIASGLYSLVVLDELNPVLNLNLISRTQCLLDLSVKPDDLEIVITGTNPPTEILEIADLHSHMEPIEYKNASGIDIFTGEGKGKSTNALGRILKEVGRSLADESYGKIMILQWLKGGTGYTEDAAITALKEILPGRIEHHRFGRDAIVWKGKEQEVDYIEAEKGWAIARKALSSGKYSVIIMDELNCVTDLELLPGAIVSHELSQKDKETNVVVTGRCCTTPSYFSIAENISYVRCNEHYANKGKSLRQGVDY